MQKEAQLINLALGMKKIGEVISYKEFADEWDLPQTFVNIRLNRKPGVEKVENGFKLTRDFSKEVGSTVLRTLKRCKGSCTISELRKARRSLNVEKVRLPLFKNLIDLGLIRIDGEIVSLIPRNRSLTPSEKRCLALQKRVEELEEEVYQKGLVITRLQKTIQEFHAEIKNLKG